MRVRVKTILDQHTGQFEFVFSLFLAAGIQATLEFSIHNRLFVTGLKRNFTLQRLLSHYGVEPPQENQSLELRLKLASARQRWPWLPDFASPHFTVHVSGTELPTPSCVTLNDSFSSEEMNGESAEIRTPISPFLTTFPNRRNSLSSGFIVTSNVFGAFPSPLLSERYTQELLRFGPTKQVIGPSKSIALAMRSPDTDNLTEQEHRIALRQLTDFLDLNGDYRVILRTHPRSGREDQALDEFLKRFPNRVQMSSEHIRILAYSASCLVSLGGTCVADGVVVGTPVLEVVSEFHLRGWEGAIFSRFGIAEEAKPNDVLSTLTRVLSEPSKVAKRQEQALSMQLPGFRTCNSDGLASLIDLCR